MPTEEQLDKIRDGLTEASEANEVFREEIRLADRAGANVSAHLTAYNETKAKLLRIKKAYGI